MQSVEGTMAEITEDPIAATTAYAQMAMGAMMNLAAPQGATSS